MMKTKITRNLALAVVMISMSGLVGCDMISSYFRAKEAAVKWEGDIKEIAFEKLDKDGKVFDVEMHSRIDAPIEKVWAAMKAPEKLAEFSEQYKKSDIIKDEGNVKEMDVHVMALDNLQAFKMRMEFDDANKSMKLTTIESAIVDIDATYKLIPSPDGTKTQYIYKAIQTDKVALPISVDVQRSALKESFVNQVRAVKKQLGIS